MAGGVGVMNDNELHSRRVASLTQQVQQGRSGGRVQGRGRGKCRCYERQRATLEESGVSHTTGRAGEGRKVVCKGEGEGVDAISVVRYT